MAFLCTHRDILITTTSRITGYWPLQRPPTQQNLAPGIAWPLQLLSDSNEAFLLTESAKTSRAKCMKIDDDKTIDSVIDECQTYTVQVKIDIRV
jgi:hypothetical protein